MLLPEHLYPVVSVIGGMTFDKIRAKAADAVLQAGNFAVSSYWICSVQYHHQDASVTLILARTSFAASFAVCGHVCFSSCSRSGQQKPYDLPEV